ARADQALHAPAPVRSAPHANRGRRGPQHLVAPAPPALRARGDHVRAVVARGTVAALLRRPPLTAARRPDGGRDRGPVGDPRRPDSQPYVPRSLWRLPPRASSRGARGALSGRRRPAGAGLGVREVDPDGSMRWWP